MAFDGFMQLDGIEGESSDAKYKGWIEISDCNMEIMQNVSTTASSVGGASAARADFSNLRFTKLMDKSSPQLALACAKGTHFNTVRVEFCRAGSEKITFMAIKLTDCLISTVTMNAGGHFPTETIHLDYGAINWTYTQQSRKGGMTMGNTAAGWNRRKNCPA
ncbi:MAG: type VI secretion system tube protein Hcp [Desulfobacteraceae bacterium]|jgi:type VI secretion system Hcp family effector